MPVYVDKMWNYGKRIGRAGPEWAHLIADTEQELHIFAKRIGMKREWFQGDHYDIGSHTLYRRAIQLGAIQLHGLDWVRKVKERRIYNDSNANRTGKT